VKTRLGVKVYKAVERSTPSQRKYFGPLRKFDMKLMNSFTKEDVVTFSRPMRCTCCLFFCCLQVKILVWNQINKVNKLSFAF
jgi:hypothetical protein